MDVSPSADCAQLSNEQQDPWSPAFQLALVHPETKSEACGHIAVLRVLKPNLVS